MTMITKLYIEKDLLVNSFNLALRDLEFLEKSGALLLVRLVDQEP